MLRLCQRSTTIYRKSPSQFAFSVRSLSARQSGAVSERAGETGLTSRELVDGKDSLQEFNRRIRLAARAGDLINVITRVHQLRAEGHTPDRTTYAAILEIMGIKHLARESLALLSDMKAMDVQPDSVCLGFVLEACSKDTEAWNDALEHVKLSNIDMDTKCYNVIAQRHIWTGSLEMCIQLLGDMSSKGFEPSPQHVLRPLFKLAAERGHPRLAMDLMVTFGAADLGKRTTEIWGEILLASVRTRYINGITTAARHLDEARSPLDNGVIMDALHVALVLADIELANNMFARLKSNLASDIKEHHYAPLVELHLKLGNYAEAVDIVSDMLSQNISTGTRLHQLLVEECRSKPLAAPKFHSCAQKRRDAGDFVAPVILNAVLRGYLARNEPDQVTAVFRSLSSFGMEPDVESYNALLGTAQLRASEPLAQAIFDDMRAAGVRPNMNTYSLMALVSLKQHTYEAAFHWLEEMKQASFKPPIYLYHAFERRLASSQDERLELVRAEMEDVVDPIRQPSREYSDNHNAASVTEGG